MTHLFFRNMDAKYAAIPGFCASLTIERAAEPYYILTPGRYVELTEDEVNFNFENRFIITP
ncbi:MAG: hypothetical protein PHH72_05415 [Parabacteroides sp.]|nr:hypothetical protein [Parabacteroides sp.]